MAANLCSVSLPWPSTRSLHINHVCCLCSNVKFFKNMMQPLPHTIICTGSHLQHSMQPLPHTIICTGSHLQHSHACQVHLCALQLQSCYHHCCIKQQHTTTINCKPHMQCRTNTATTTNDTPACPPVFDPCGGCNSAPTSSDQSNHQCGQHKSALGGITQHQLQSPSPPKPHTNDSKGNTYSPPSSSPSSRDLSRPPSKPPPAPLAGMMLK